MNPFTRIPVWLAVLLLAFVFEAAVAQPAEGRWRLLPEAFITLQDGRQQATLDSLSAEIVFSPQGDTASLSFHATLASVQTGSSCRDALYWKEKGISVEHYPHLELQSRHIQRVGKGQYVMEAVVRLAGKSRPVRIPLVWQQQKQRTQWKGEFTLFTRDYYSGKRLPVRIRNEKLRVSFELPVEKIPAQLAVTQP